MLLTIDIGNSNIAFGIYQDEWRHHWRAYTVKTKTADEYEVLLRSLMATREVPLPEIRRVVLSSVVPQLTQTIRRVIIRLFGQEPLLVSSALTTGLRFRIDNPAEIGPDLVANAVAGYQQARQRVPADNCIVVDFGTALTLTVVNRQAEVLGVAIAPGLETAMAALSTNTAQLPFVQLQAPPSPIGKNTVHAIQSGIVLGYAGLVESLVDRIKAELDGSTRVIATGGLSEVMAPLIGRFSAIEPWLTLDGLRLIADLNPPE